MKTKTITTYSFDELSEDAQDKAIEKLANINCDYEWWDSICDDAEAIGLKIASFDLDRNRHCKGHLTQDPLAVIELIKANHGESCDTYKLAIEWENKFTQYKDAIDYDDLHDQDDDFEPRFCESDLEDDSEEFSRALCEEYACILQKEYEYLGSRETIVETIKANEYEFDENGNLA